MRPAKTKLKRFRMETKYVHHRSEGLTRRRNKGTRLLVLEGPDHQDGRNLPDKK